MDYQEFIHQKSQVGGASGFEPLWMPDFLFDFQKALVEWAIRKGRAAIFADCGLGKTPMQLVWAENVCRHTGRRVLILTPLAVANQTEREAVKFGIDATRSPDGKLSSLIAIANYERLHLFNSEDFCGVVCDESSILKSYSGATRKAITRFMNKLPYRLLCTATAAPNDYVELGTSAEALGELSHSEMLKRFFMYLDDKGQKKEQRIQDEAETLVEHDPSYYKKLAYRIAQTIGQWRLKHHAVTPFWRWVVSWAKSCRMPSDLGFDDGKFILPELRERYHIIKAETCRAGMLFNLPAFGMGEEREERRRTLKQRCDFVAELVNHKRPALLWCHMNCEGDLLEKLIPNSLQVAGKDSEEYKVAVTEWFIGAKCICNDPMFSAKLATWQRNRNDHLGTGRDTIESIVRNALSNRTPTDGNMLASESNTSPSTTSQIGVDTCSRQNKKLSGRRKPDSVMRPTQPTANTASEKPRNTASDTRTLESPEPCGNVVQLLQSMSDLSHWGALSVEQKNLVIQGVTDYISTTTTTPGNSAVYSALNAILGSENLEMIRDVLNTPQCICGHKSGNRKLISKPKIYGFGCNFQHCSHVVTFASHSYEQYYQSIRRCWRFGQTRPVDLDVIATDGEVRVLGNMRRKAEKSDVMFKMLVREMNNATKINGVNHFTKGVEVPSWLSKSK